MTEQPVLAVVSGEVSPEEVAALLAVVQAASAATPAAQPRRSEWGSPRRAVRAPVTAAPDGWRRSALPS